MADEFIVETLVVDHSSSDIILLRMWLLCLEVQADLVSKCELNDAAESLELWIYPVEWQFVLGKIEHAKTYLLDGKLDAGVLRELLGHTDRMNSFFRALG